jgi:hypothetical protein
MDYATGYRDGFAAGIAQGMSMGVPAALPAVANDESPARAPRKKVSAYNRRYKAAFKKVAPRYKLKSGKWKAGGFRRAVKEAHKIAGGKKR